MLASRSPDWNVLNSLLGVLMLRVLRVGPEREAATRLQGWTAAVRAVSPACGLRIPARRFWSCGG